jgi:ATP-dependent Clp protease ATP-binding subunit ClpA
MPRDRDFKRLVRRRMRKTGESYAAARAQMAGVPPGPAPAEPAARRPFEMLTTSARRVLVIAQEQAGARGARETGTEHLLAGLAAESGGVAARALGAAGVDPGAVAVALGGGRGAPAGAEPRAPAPSATVHRALELAFAEARAAGSGFVGTEHLLLGVVAEGGAGARILAGLGVTEARARSEVERALRAGAAAPAPPPRPWNKPRGHHVEWVLEEALRRALDDPDAVVVGLDHVLAALAAHPAGAALLATPSPGPAAGGAAAPTAS